MAEVELHPIVAINRLRLKETLEALLKPLLTGDSKKFDVNSRKVRTEILSKKFIVEGFKYVDFDEYKNNKAIDILLEDVISEVERILSRKLKEQQRNIVRKTYI